jgi:hypothetical protein
MNCGKAKPDPYEVESELTVSVWVVLTLTCESHAESKASEEIATYAVKYDLSSAA